MLTPPKLEERDEQPYAAIAVRVTMSEIGAKVPPLVPEVFGWLGQRGIAPSGPPFFRYLVIDMRGILEIEAGVPTAVAVTGDGRVRAGSFPAGRYATAVHTGHPDELVAATAELLAWAEANEISWQIEESPAGDVWGARIEFYLTDPREEPDMAKWQTELVFLTAPNSATAPAA
jgi:effector-binding domain-containing protein